jgi:membrane-associated protease RseP (regulator of RpoE activity)
MYIQFLTSLYICVIVHEFGHLIAAKLCGCGVPTYAVGFGKILFHKKVGNTDYQFRLLPLGGFCELEGELTRSKKKSAFTNLKYSKKVLISAAGCIVNIVSGVIVGLIGLNTLNQNLLYFGLISTSLGIMNLLPIVPCLDGGYIAFFPLCTKIWGKEKGILIFAKMVKISFKIVMWLNYLCIPWLIMNWRKL